MLELIKMSSSISTTTSTAAKYFMCYLLRSLNVKHPKSTYIGFTVHPKRRIRQHNGIISGGAFRTRKKRPWDMATVVEGFPNKVSALQFEYAWTNPNRSRLLKGYVGKTKKYGFNNKMELLAILLSIEPFKNYGLSIHCQHQDVVNLWDDIVNNNTGTRRRRKKQRKGDGGGGGKKLSSRSNTIVNEITDFTPLKHSVKVSIGSLDHLKVYQDDEEDGSTLETHRIPSITQEQVPSLSLRRCTAIQNEESNATMMDWPNNLNVNIDHCVFCDDVLDSINGYARCPHCHVKGHLICMSEKILENDPLSLLPKNGKCIFCESPVKWSNMIVRGSKKITPRQSPYRRNLNNKNVDDGKKKRKNSRLVKRKLTLKKTTSKKKNNDITSLSASSSIELRQKQLDDTENNNLNQQHEVIVIE